MYSLCLIYPLSKIKWADTCSEPKIKSPAITKDAVLVSQLLNSNMNFPTSMCFIPLEHPSGVFMVNFEHISQFVLVFLLLSLSR